MDRTYTVDQWTVKFLLQHAIPIGGEINTPASSDLAERGKFASDALSMLRPAGMSTNGNTKLRSFHGSTDLVS